MQLWITQLERNLLVRLASGVDLDPLRVPGSTVHELQLTCLEYEGLERLAKASDCSLDAFIRDAVTKAVSMSNN